MKSNILKFEVLKEEITAENVLEMSEVIAFAQTRFLIGYMGTRMQKIYAEVYNESKQKTAINKRFFLITIFQLLRRLKKCCIMNIDSVFCCRNT